MPPKKTPSGNSPEDNDSPARNRGFTKDGTPTETSRMYAILQFDSTKARALQAEHIRTLIRQSGCTGLKDEKAHDLIYTILFGDETTLLHFRRFQGMWQYRRLGPHAEGPQADWWAAFRWFLRDAFSKCKTQIDKSGYERSETFGDDDGQRLPPQAGDDTEVGQAGSTGNGRAKNGRTDAKSGKRSKAQEIWPLPASIALLTSGRQGKTMRYRNDATEAAGPASGSGSGPFAFMAVIIDPDRAGYSSRNGVRDLYDPFGATTSRHFTNTGSLTLVSVFQSVKRLAPDREPRALYGCMFRPRDSLGMLNEDGEPDTVQERRARDAGQTYALRADDTTLLWTDRTVSAFFRSVSQPPWVLVILRRNPAQGRGDTPPRGPQVTLDPVGRAIAAPPLPSLRGRDIDRRPDLLAAVERVARLKRRLDEETGALDVAALDMGLEKDSAFLLARKRLKLSSDSTSGEGAIDDLPEGDVDDCENENVPEEEDYYGDDDDDDESLCTLLKARRSGGKSKSE